MRYVWCYFAKTRSTDEFIRKNGNAQMFVAVPTKCGLTVATALQNELGEDAYIQSLVCLGECGVV